MGMGVLGSVNVGAPREVPHRDGTVRTGIFKQPVSGPVLLRRTQLEGDGQADLEAHGGADKAAYAYSLTDYAYWERELGRSDLASGSFGENFTVEGADDGSVHIGDVFRVGGALVEVTQPRVPCFKLGLRLGLPEFPKRFLASGRVGFYLRVLEEGEVEVGDELQRLRVGIGRVSVREACRLLHFEHENLEGVRRVLRNPALSRDWRRSFEKLLRRVR